MICRLVCICVFVLTQVVLARRPVRPDRYPDPEVGRPSSPASWSTVKPIVFRPTKASGFPILKHEHEHSHVEDIENHDHGHFDHDDQNPIITVGWPRRNERTTKWPSTRPTTTRPWLKDNDTLPYDIIQQHWVRKSIRIISAKQF